MRLADMAWPFHVVNWSGPANQQGELHTLHLLIPSLWLTELLQETLWLSSHLIRVRRKDQVSSSPSLPPALLEGGGGSIHCHHSSLSGCVGKERQSVTIQHPPPTCFTHAVGLKQGRWWCWNSRSQCLTPYSIPCPHCCFPKQPDGQGGGSSSLGSEWKTRTHFGLYLRQDAAKDHTMLYNVWQLDTEVVHELWACACLEWSGAPKC